MIKNNIALKNGDYPGKSDVTRMRESIVNKAGDQVQDDIGTGGLL